MIRSKQELRQLIAGMKASRSDATLNALSEDAIERLEQHPAFLRAGTILIYHSMADEVRTPAFIRKWSERKRILLPAVVGDVLEIRPYTNPVDLSAGVFGIKEPTSPPFRDLEAIDLVVVPGVAFDLTGGRLGRGKGYYDKLLPQLSAYKIGICFPFQIVDKVPVDAFDVRMDEVLYSLNKTQYS